MSERVPASSRDEVRQWILDRIGEELGDHRITGADNFLELGGHSMMAIELKTRIAREHGLSISLADLFQRSISATVARAEDGKATV
ncbi:acyl carrier protein [Streptomyces sp. NPDC002755]|uniref:acyl carrier protein n=1 Tax=Streptomyces sp. NPDC002884 TaxID=3154544 RepID=UPI00331E57F1